MSDLDVIKEIEKLIGKELKPCPPNESIMDNDNTYELNSNQDLIGLNLYNHGFITLYFFLQFNKIKKLSLTLNHLGLSLYMLRPVRVKIFKIFTTIKYCENSQLLRLPELKNLTHLCLRANGLTHDDFICLKDLTNLVYLDLSHNNRSPYTKTGVKLERQNLKLDFLRNLKKLEYLVLDNNFINDISPLEKLNCINYLSLENNNISNIKSLKEMKNIKFVSLRDNKISVLPEWILDLNLNIKWEGYSFNELPTGIRIDLSFIDDPDEANIVLNNSIYLVDNPLEQPPVEIVRQGNEAIRAYFEQLKKGQDSIYEAKLILVGEGGAGKTSLANKIINSDWQLIPEIESQSTQGIEILRYEFPYNDKIFRVNIWDFGGQEIYHFSHQFFLTKRTLYLFVIEPPLIDDSCNQNILKDNKNPDYWFNTVDLLSSKSPILIVKNEKQNRPCVIEESKLRAAFNNIKDSFSADLSNNRGLPEIVKALQYYITDLPHIGSPLPKTWVKVREQLEQDNRYHIELKEYFAICQTNGFEKEADKLQLSGYLHDLGVCLHFQNDAQSSLYKTLILKPTWATDAVYKVLDNDMVKNREGQFTSQDLADIWQAEEYNTMRGELLALMQKFKLCYEIPRKPQHYIAPQLLKDKAPPYNWQASDLLLLRYKYDFMPKGILSQFIVEMHEYIAHNYEWVWKSGVILEKENTQAEVIEYYGKREIHIRVVGQNKKELLNIVSYELDKINGSYERLKHKCKKLIPCLCETCKGSEEPHFFSLPDLNRFRQKGVQTIQCLYSGEMVNVLGLIDDINLPGFKNLEGLSYKAKEVYNNCTFNQPNGEMTVNNEEHNIDAKDSQVQQFNESSNNTATQTQNKPAESKEDSLFKKLGFYALVFAFVYSSLAAVLAYDLQKDGKVGNRTYKEIVSLPITVMADLFKDEKKEEK